MEQNEKQCKKLKTITNLKIKGFLNNSNVLIVLNSRLGCSRDKIEEFSDFMFRVEFVRKNLTRKIEERKYTSKIPFKESLIIDIDYDNDILEVSYNLLNEHTKKSKISKFSIVRVKDLIKEEDKEDVWILSRQSILNVRYHVSKEEVQDLNCPSLSSIIQPIIKYVDFMPGETAEDFTSRDNLSTNLVSRKSSFNCASNNKKDSLRLNSIIEGKSIQTKSSTAINYEITVNSIKNERVLNNSYGNKKALFNHENSNKVASQQTNQTLYNPSSTRKYFAIPKINNDSKTPSSFSSFSPKKANPIKSNNSQELSPLTLNVKPVDLKHLFSNNIETVPQNSDSSSNFKISEKSASDSPTNIAQTGTNSNMKYFASTNIKHNITLNGNNISGIEVIDYEVLENTSTANSELNYDTFCEAFFVSGLPTRNPKIISNSEDYKAPCCHKDCSLLSSYRPEMLYKYQKSNPSDHLFELSNVTSSLCFPSGIKVCYATDEKIIKPIKNFLNIITNEKGEKFYVINYHYYKKVDYITFQAKYNYDPIKIFVKNYFEAKSNLEMKGDKKLQTCLKWANNDYIYIPECLTLITKYPFRIQLESCLQTLFTAFSNLENNKNNLSFNPMDELIRMIHHFVDEVPVPPINKKLIFYIPFHNGPLELPGIQNGSLPTLNYNLKVILETFSIENIILIFHLVLLEQKILFIDDDYHKLSEISQSFISLIHPLGWENNLVPVLSEEFIKYLLSIVPFIMGIDESLLKTAYKMKYILPEDEENVVFLVNIKKNSIDRSTNKKNKKLSKKNILEGIPDFPEEIYEELNSELKLIKKIIDDPKSKNNLCADKIDSTIRQVFVKIMVMLIGDYSSYLNEVSGDLPAFNNNLFVNSRSKENQDFYRELIQSQIFIQFLMNEKKGIGSYFFKMCIKYHNLINISKKSNRKIKINRSSSVTRGNLTSADNKLTTEPNRSFNIIDGQKLSSVNVLTYNTSQNKTKEWASCQSFSLANENTASNTKELVDYLMITPYFVNDPITKFDLNKIEEFMHEKYNKIDNSNDLLENRILVNNKNIFESLNEKSENNLTRYFLNSTTVITNFSSNLCKSDGKNVKVKSSSFNLANVKLGNDCNGVYPIKSAEENVHKYDSLIRYINLSKNIISKETNEINKTRISDCLRKVFTSQSLSAEIFEEMSKLLKTREGRGIFSTVVFQTSFTCNNHQILSADSFTDLQKLISIALSYTEDDPYEFIATRSIAKSTFFYYKTQKNSKKFIYSELNPTQYPIFKNQSFWVLWNELDTEQEQNVFNSTSDFSFNNLLVLASYMSKFNIDLKDIKTLIVDVISPKYFNTKTNCGLKMLKDLHNCVEKEYKLYINFKDNR